MLSLVMQLNLAMRNKPAKKGHTTGLEEETVDKYRKVMAGKPKARAAEVGKRIGAHRTAAYEYLLSLVKYGYVKKHESDARGKPVYFEWIKGK